jgi:hypothetical protein
LVGRFVGGVVGRLEGALVLHSSHAVPFFIINGTTSFIVTIFSNGGLSKQSNKLTWKGGDLSTGTHQKLSNLF